MCLMTETRLDREFTSDSPKSRSFQPDKPTSSAVSERTAVEIFVLPAERGSVAELLCGEAELREQGAGSRSSGLIPSERYVERGGLSAIAREATPG
ncbi:hypothetical protein AOLI_G00068210 [Acnodon oligacanthus]